MISDLPPSERSNGEEQGEDEEDDDGDDPEDPGDDGGVRLKGVVQTVGAGHLNSKCTMKLCKTNGGLIMLDTCEKSTMFSFLVIFSAS